MIWNWQEPFEAALREKDPDKLRPRLIAAEQAIFQRLQQLPAGANQLAEAQALREALNRLYALFPKEHYAPGQIEDEDADPMRRDWLRLIVPIGLGLTLAFAIAVTMARRSERDYAQSMAAQQKQVVRNSRTSTIPPRDLPIAGIRPDNARVDKPRAANSNPDAYARQAPAESSAADARPDARADVSRENAQKRSTNVAPDAAVGGQSNAASVRAIGRFPDSGAQAPAAPTENAPPQEFVGKSAASTGGNSAQASEESQGQTPETGAPENSEIPQGSVTVNASAYPSIRVPPDVKAQASASGESFQIGEPISRVDPVYPEEAERQHIEGTVKLRALVGKDGVVQNVEIISGPPLLTPTAVGAVRQWRYEPTLLGDQPVEVADDITIIFHLANATAVANRP
jgi:TonB family protein